MKDPGLIADAKKINTTFQPMTGDEVQAAFNSYFNTPRDIVEKTYQMTLGKKNPRKKIKK